MRVLGIDLGTVRVGLAVSDPGGVVATPLTTVPVDAPGDLDALADRLATIARDQGAEEAVIGLPRSLAGREGGPARRARELADLLRGRGVDRVDLWDERFTTVEAERTMLEQDASRSERRAAVDRVAATLILQSYLDARRAGR